jgi:uncharacterized protein (DUF1697 family)
LSGVAGGTLHVALLRGINVGKAKRIAMADLRDLVEGLGYGGVRTLLNSGNVVFSTAGAPKSDPAHRLERASLDRLGLSCKVVVLSAGALESLIAENPLLDRMGDPSRFLVGCFHSPSDRELLAPLLARDWGEDALALGPQGAYLWCAKGVLDSPLSQAFARALKDRATTRNWSTILKLQAMMREGS